MLTCLHNVRHLNWARLSLGSRVHVSNVGKQFWVSLLFLFFWNIFLPGFYRRALQNKALFLFVGTNRQTILLFLKAMLKSMEDSEETLICSVINRSLAPIAVIWRARTWNQPVTTIVTYWLSMVFWTPATAERRCYRWELRSLSVLQEGRVWRCGCVSLTSNRATDSPWVCCPAPAKSPHTFQLSREENAGNSSSWFCRLYYCSVLENEGFWGPEESWKLSRGLWRPLFGLSTCWPLMYLGPR